ncbi:MAG TPA: efflux RND transporter periplasmic adaptor subunit [Candidatus Methylacidiphilales bacterium]|nr:efflux RND transporter periplasmic adaptor subunit [Candidatus Methylacidiphilales bacterium]
MEQNTTRTILQPKPPAHNGQAASAMRSVSLPQVKRSSSARFWVWPVLILALAGVGYGVVRYLCQSGKGQAAGGAGNGVRVVTATANRGDMPVYLTALGNVTALYTDTIQSRVSGQLMKVLFTEGQTVKAGDLLVQIDSRPYEAQLAQYMAQKEHDQALLDNANIDLQRYQTLWQQNSIPQQTLATQVALVKQDEGTVAIDQALIDATKLNITYCNITAPIDGWVGLRLVDPGNYVQSTATTGLLSIVQIQPITVIFTIPEDSLPEVMSKVDAGQKLTVEAYERGGFTKKLAMGELLATDNQINPSTGTLQFKAIFSNTDKALIPNQFVNVKLLVDTKKNVILVPMAAIQHGSQGDFVYVVDPDSNTASMKTVTVGTTALDGSNAEITDGLSEGDVVITSGVDKLQDGSKVVVTKPGAPGNGPSTNGTAVTSPINMGN